MVLMRIDVGGGGDVAQMDWQAAGGVREVGRLVGWG